MTPEAQRTAIAKVCGWKPRGAFYSGVREEAQSPPDYVNDLNAMHEAEKILFNGEFRGNGYGNLLMDIVRRDANLKWFQQAWLHASINRAVHATAAQRAEALLRCMNAL